MEVSTNYDSAVMT